MRNSTKVQDRSKRRAQVDQIVYKLLMDGLGNVGRGEPCPYQRINSEGGKYCYASHIEGSINDKLARRHCPHIAESRKISVIRDWNIDLPEYDKMIRKKFATFSEEGREILRKTFQGDPEKDIMASMEHSCGYVPATKTDNVGGCEEKC